MEIDPSKQLTFSVIHASSHPRKIKIRAESADKNVWISEEIDEDHAKEISNRDYGLQAIEQIVNIIVANKTIENNILVQVESIKEDLKVLIKVKETFCQRTITINLEKQPLTETTRLEQLLLESNKKICQLQKQLDETIAERQNQQRFTSHFMNVLRCDPRGNSSMFESIEACRLSLPIGFWLVEYSFAIQVPFPEEIPYFINVAQSIKKFYVAKGPHQALSVSGRLLISPNQPNNDVSLHFESLTEHEYYIECIILTVIRVET